MVWTSSKRKIFENSLYLLHIALANKNQPSVNLIILALSLTSMSESARHSRVPVWSEDGYRLQNQARFRRQRCCSPHSMLQLSEVNFVAHLTGAHTLTDCSRKRDAVPLAVACVYQWPW